MLLQKHKWFINVEVQEIETEAISGDEFWSFVKKTEKMFPRRNNAHEIAGLVSLKPRITD